MIASIPSPSSGSIHLGPLALNAYGLMIALGVVAAVWLAGRRFEARGIATREEVGSLAVWAVAAGVIGARLYHVATDWERFQGHWLDAFKIWQGGLGIPGGMFLGVLVGVWVARRRGIPLGPALAAGVPSLPLAQAIGRWGNWFNQELYGRPTTLPWGLEIDHPPARYAPGTTFHPTFLYESLWNLGLTGLLLWLDRRFRLRGGQMMAIYVAGYGLGRFWIEGLRIDPAKAIGPFRWNQWVALFAVVAGTAYLLWSRGRAEPALATDDGPIVSGLPGGRDDAETPAPEGMPASSGPVARALAATSAARTSAAVSEVRRRRRPDRRRARPVDTETGDPADVDGERADHADPTARPDAPAPPLEGDDPGPLAEVDDTDAARD